VTNDTHPPTRLLTVCPVYACADRQRRISKSVAKMALCPENTGDHRGSNYDADLLLFYVPHIPPMIPRLGSSLISPARCVGLRKQSADVRGRMCRTQSERATKF
jgi:hypothetical protein